MSGEPTADLPAEIQEPLDKLAAMMPAINAATDKAMETFRRVEVRLAPIAPPATYTRFADTNIDTPAYALVWARYGPENKFRFCIHTSDKGLIAVDEAERSTKLLAIAVLPTLLKQMVERLKITSSS